MSRFATHMFVKTTLWRYRYLLTVIGIISFYFAVIYIRDYLPISDHRTTIYYYNTLFDQSDQYKTTFSKWKSSLFCPLTNNDDITKYNKISKHIYDLQFGINSSCQYMDTKKYFIFRESPLGHGMFSVIDNHHLVQWTLALALNRKFLILNDNNYRFLPISNGKNLIFHCNGRTGRNCYFKPISNCNNQQIENILNNARIHNSLLNINQHFCKSKWLSFKSFQHFIKYTDNYNVILYDVETFKFICRAFEYKLKINKKFTNKHVIEKNKYGDITFHQFNALLVSILWRLQNNIKSKINDIVNKSLVKYNWTDIENTLSLPIRASDKCYQNGGGEYWCISMEQQMNAIQRFKDKFNDTNIDTVIITSEDPNIINQYKRIKSKYKFVFNDFDILPNTGSQPEIRKELTTDKDYFNLMISVLSSMKLQMNGKYFIVRHRSNWVHAIWKIANSFHCQLNNNNDNDNDNNHTRHCINFDIDGYEQPIDTTCLRTDRFAWPQSFGKHLLK